MNKKKVSKVVASVLAAAMAMSSLAGCGDKGGNNSSKSGGSSDGSKTLVLDVFDDQANFQGTQSGWYGDYIKKKFNIELNIIAPNVAGGGDTLFQTRSANGDLGDIIITKLDGDRLKDLVTAGLVLDMTPYLDKCDNLKRYQVAIDEATKLAGQDGVWAIPSEVSTLSATDPCDAQEPTNAPSIRWDIYKEIGYPEMKNMDDFLDVLEKMQEQARKDEGSDDIYALSLFKDWDGEVMQNAAALPCLYGYQQLGFCMTKVDGSDIQSVTDKSGIYVKSLNFIYEANQRGLIDPESTTQDFTTMQTKYKDGKILYSLWPWLGAGVYNTEEHMSEGKGFATATIDDMQCLEYGCMPYGKMGTGIMIGSQAEDPERIAEFIDWLYSPEGVEISSIINSTSCGPEGLTWEMKDGEPVLTEFGEQAFVKNDQEMDITDEWGGGSWIDGQSALNYKSVGLVDCDPDTGMCYNYKTWKDYQEKTATALSTDWSEHNGGALNAISYLSENGKLLVLPGSTYAKPAYDTDISAIQEQCKQIIIEYSWKMAFAKDDAEFNSFLDEMITTVEGLGYDQVLAVDKKNCEDQNAAFEAAKAVTAK